jgi:hypothetical protein
MKKSNANEHKDIPRFDTVPTVPLPKESRTAGCIDPMDDLQEVARMHVEYYLSNYSGKKRGALTEYGQKLCQALHEDKYSRGLATQLADMSGTDKGRVLSFIGKCKNWAEGVRPQKPRVAWLLDTIAPYYMYPDRSGIAKNLLLDTNRIPEEIREACAHIPSQEGSKTIASHKRSPILQVHRDIAALMVDAVSTTSGLTHIGCALNVYQYFVELVDWTSVGVTATENSFNHGYMSIRKTIHKRWHAPKKGKHAESMSKEMLAIFDKAYEMHCVSPSALHSIIRHGYINHPEIIEAIEHTAKRKKDLRDLNITRESDKRISYLEEKVKELSDIINLRSNK